MTSLACTQGQNVCMLQGFEPQSHQMRHLQCFPFVFSVPFYPCTCTPSWS